MTIHCLRRENGGHTPFMIHVAPSPIVGGISATN